MTDDDRGIKGSLKHKTDLTLLLWSLLDVSKHANIFESVNPHEQRTQCNVDESFIVQALKA